MIRIIDCEIYAVEKTDITRIGLLGFFCNNHTEDFVVVYSQGIYEGVISYQHLLDTASENVDDIIIKEVYVCKSDNSKMFVELSQQFKTAGMPLITIINEDGQILYFAYRDNSSQYEDIEIVMKNLEADVKEQLPFLEDIYPKIKKVRIENLNEFAFRLYSILKKRGMAVGVYGEKWEVLFPGLCEGEETAVPENNILTIYADGVSEIGLNKDEDIRKRWQFIIEIGGMTHNYITEKYRAYFERIGVRCMTAYFPKMPRNVTVAEAYRYRAGIEPHGKAGWRQELSVKQIQQVYGSKIDENTWRKLAAKRDEDQRYIRGTQTAIHYGTAKNKIYLIGACVVRGLTVTSLDDTLGACLNEEIRKISGSYVVEGIICNGIQAIEYENILKSLTITENDIVILVDIWHGLYKGKCTRDILIDDIFEQRECDWFYDVPIHTNYIGNKKLSQAICQDYLASIIQKDKDKCQILQLGEVNLDKDAKNALNQYVELVRVKNTKEGMKTGAIVMNCNPMTTGHLHLIDTARRKVDLLYIFIVEEDKSEFAFKERLALVRNETSSMENVVVVPSGQFVLSYTTMPLYFEKEEKKQALLDATDDLKIFGTYIAPELEISVRFVGEEPIDQVTRQYNEAMKSILPMYGVEVVEIPRFEQDGKIVSASRVRRYLREGKMEQVKKMVPESVYSYLCRKKQNFCNESQDSI